MNEIMRIKNILLAGTLLLSTTIFAQSNPDKSIGWYWAIEPKVGMTVGDFSEGLAVIKQKPNANRHSEQHDRGGMEKLEFDEIIRLKKSCFLYFFLL